MISETRRHGPAASETPPDPAWAWAPYVPGATRPWCLRQASHLYRRAAFGASWGQLQQALHDGPGPTVDRLVRPEADVAAFHRTFDAYEAAAIDPDAITADGLCDWWLRRMIQTPHPLQEKLTLLWHGHFSVRNFRVKNGQMMARYVRTLREHARRLGPLVSAVLQEPAARLSFDANANRKSKPDLTLARALLERFTLGPGVATERDLGETARALTGLAVLRNQSRVPTPRARRGGEGGPGARPVTGLTSMSQGLPRPTPARRDILRVIYRWFVSEADEPADAMLGRRWPMTSPATGTLAVLSRRCSGRTCSSPRRPGAARSRVRWNWRWG